MTALDTARLKELAEKATALPWFVYDGQFDNDLWRIGKTIGSTPDGTRICDITPLRKDRLAFADAEYIVAACSALPALLSRITELETALREIADNLREARDTKMATLSRDEMIAVARKALAGETD